MRFLFLWRFFSALGGLSRDLRGFYPGSSPAGTERESGDDVGIQTVNSRERKHNSTQRHTDFPPPMPSRKTFTSTVRRTNVKCPQIPQGHLLRCFHVQANTGQLDKPQWQWRTLGCNLALIQVRKASHGDSTVLNMFK